MAILAGTTRLLTFFLGFLKTEHVYFEKYKTRTQARLSVFKWIESFSHREGMQLTLGFLSPEGYEGRIA